LPLWLGNKNKKGIPHQKKEKKKKEKKA